MRGEGAILGMRMELLRRGSLLGPCRLKHVANAVRPVARPLQVLTLIPVMKATKTMGTGACGKSGRARRNPSLVYALDRRWLECGTAWEKRIAEGAPMWRAGEGDIYRK